MKKHSDNIRAKGGFLAVPGLNVFQGSSEVDFAECLRRVRSVVQEIIDTQKENAQYRVYERGAGIRSLLDLSVPVFRPLDSDPTAYEFMGPLFVLGESALAEGSVVRVGESGELVMVAGDWEDDVLAVPARFALGKYDNYNATSLEEISDEVLRELDVPLDRDDLTANMVGVDAGVIDLAENGLVEVKYTSIYAPEVSALAHGREHPRLIAVPVCVGEDGDPTDGVLAPDESYLRSLLEDEKTWCGRYFDHFFVEFTDPRQPFAYISVEEMNTVRRDDGEMQMVDHFAGMWDGTAKEMRAGIELEQIAEMLRGVE